MKVALYCRVSHEDQVKDGVSIDTQKQDLIDYCKSNKLDYDLYVDEGISAKDIKHRTELNNLLKNIDNYSSVLFTKLDRLSRNVLDANYLNNIFIKHNVTMKAINDNDIDTSTAEGKFMFNLMYSLAERELGKDSERINAVFAYKVRILHEVTSGTHVFGYDIVNKHYVINEEEANILREAFDVLIDTKSICKAVDFVRSRTNLKDYSTIWSKFKNIRYTGDTIYKGELVENYCPVIIPKDKFNRAQEILKNNRRVGNTRNRVYLFTTLMKCPVCGKKMYASHRDKTNYYSCSINFTKTQVRCTNGHSYREDVIEQYLINTLFDPNIKLELEAKKTIKKVKKDNTQEIKSKLNKLIDLYLNGMIDKQEYEKRYNMYNKELSKEKGEEQVEDYSHILKLINNKNILDIYNVFDIKEKQEFWSRIISSITPTSSNTFDIKFLSRN